MSTAMLLSFVVLSFFPAAYCQFCGGVATLSAKQMATITSPNYPVGYPWLTKCDWVLTFPLGYFVQLTCADFSVLYTSNGCDYDYLQISKTGDATFSSSLKACGVGTLDYEVRSNILRAKFYTTYNNKYYPNIYYEGFTCTAVAIEGPDLVTEKPATEAPESNSSCFCGIKGTNERIINGTVANLHEYPWQVIVRKSNGFHYCGGTIIHPQWIVTAAHCVDGFTTSNMFVSVGDHDKNSESETSLTQHLAVSRIIKHEKFNSTTVDNDIALLKLSTPVTFNEGVGPACLPFNFKSRTFSGENGTVTGHGVDQYGGFTTDLLNEVELPILSTDECREYYMGKLISDNMLCTYEVGKDSCQGDSGGPLVWECEGKNYLIGIVSWGIGCALEDRPGVYTKVTNYLRWIKDRTGVQFCTPPTTSSCSAGTKSTKSLINQRWTPLLKQKLIVEDN